MSVGATTSSGNSGATTGANKGSGMDELESGEFLKLLIAELSNQDPLNPMDNTQLVQQISTIREISATTKLEETLSSVTTSQNLASATSLIGKNVKALTDKGADITGIVDKATVEVNEKDNTRTYRIHMGTESVQLKNVREVLE